MPDWPWRENRLARRTRIAHLYRDVLLEAHPQGCAQLDDLLDSYNQHLITGNSTQQNPHEPTTGRTGSSHRQHQACN